MTAAAVAVAVAVASLLSITTLLQQLLLPLPDIIYQHVHVSPFHPFLLPGLLEGISGHVLEIGPGPATNFRCLYPPTDIVDWVGVEPNNYFLDVIEEQKQKWNISFDTRLTWLKGENIDAEDEGFDAVVSTHVLCSVSDVNQVRKCPLLFAKKCRSVMEDGPICV
jgi:hypothetical protein